MRRPLSALVIAHGHGAPHTDGYQLGEGCSVKRASDKWRRSIERQGIAFRSCVLYLIEFVAFRDG